MKKIIILIIVILLVMMAIVAYTAWNGVQLARILPERLKTEYKTNKEVESRYLKMNDQFKKVVIDTKKLPMIGESVEIIPPEYDMIFAQQAYLDFEEGFLKAQDVRDIDKTAKFYEQSMICAGVDMTFKQAELMALFLIIRARSLIDENPAKSAELFTKVILFGADVAKGISLDSSIISVVFGSGLITLSAKSLLKIHEKTPEILQQYKEFYRFISRTRPTFVDIIKLSHAYTLKFITIVLQEMGFHFKIMNFFYGDPAKELNGIYDEVYKIFEISDETRKLAALTEFFGKYPEKISHPLVRMVFLDFLKSYSSYQNMLEILKKLAE